MIYYPVGTSFWFAGQSAMRQQIGRLVTIHLHQLRKAGPFDFYVGTTIHIDVTRHVTTFFYIT